MGTQTIGTVKKILKGEQLRRVKPGLYTCRSLSISLHFCAGLLMGIYLWMLRLHVHESWQSMSDHMLCKFLMCRGCIELFCLTVLGHIWTKIKYFDCSYCFTLLFLFYGTSVWLRRCVCMSMLYTDPELRGSALCSHSSLFPVSSMVRSRREAGGFLMSPPCLESQGCQFDPTFLLYLLSCSSA